MFRLNKGFKLPFLGRNLVLVSICWVSQWLPFSPFPLSLALSHLTGLETILSPAGFQDRSIVMHLKTCLLCILNISGLDLAESCSSCLAVFLGLLQFFPASLHPGRVEDGEGMKARLAAASNLFLVASGYATRPGYGFIAMDLAEWRS